MKRLDKTIEQCVRDLLEFCKSNSVAVVDELGMEPYGEKTKEFDLLIERCRRKVDNVPYDVERPELKGDSSNAR
jgi:hypothetical protein